MQILKLKVTFGLIFGFGLWANSADLEVTGQMSSFEWSITTKAILSDSGFLQEIKEASARGRKNDYLRTTELSEEEIDALKKELEGVVPSRATRITVGVRVEESFTAALVLAASESFPPAFVFAKVPSGKWRLLPYLTELSHRIGEPAPVVKVRYSPTNYTSLTELGGKAKVAIEKVAATNLVQLSRPMAIFDIQTSSLFFECVDSRSYKRLGVKVLTNGSFGNVYSIPFTPAQLPVVTERDFPKAISR